MQENRAPRCDHGFYVSLCVVPSCPHFDGHSAEPADLPDDWRPPQNRGATARVRDALGVAPTARNAEIAARCPCSLSLVAAVRSELGLQRRKGPGRPFNQP